ncbi:MAG: rod shape-determining protein MreD [Ilumatobacter sp.]|uniref:rod shape-determining protein MreD n=1 Tax=Ilumatobacter sp. TaxID=1967498 RepID=UPI003C777EAD
MFAAIIRSSLIRLIPVGMVMLALQRTVFAEIQVSGVIVQVVLAFAAAAGAAGGSERGAVAGFTLGIMFDLVEGTPVGSTAIAFTLAGVVAGLLALIAADPQWWLSAIFVGLGAAVGEAMVPVVRIFIGEQDPWPSQMVKVVAVVAIAAVVMSPLLVPLGRWCLRIRGPEWKAPAELPPV